MRFVMRDGGEQKYCRRHFRQNFNLICNFNFNSNVLEKKQGFGTFRGHFLLNTNQSTPLLGLEPTTKKKHIKTTIS
jgi:hypothetical protein